VLREWLHSPRAWSQSRPDGFKATGYPAGVNAK
jgi:hypothetical protein